MAEEEIIWNRDPVTGLKVQGRTTNPLNSKVWDKYEVERYMLDYEE